MTLITTQVSESVSPICPSHDSVVDTVNPSFPPSLIPTSISRDGPLDLLSPFQHIASPLTETTSMEDLNNIDQESRELLPGENMVRSFEGPVHSRHSHTCGPILPVASSGQGEQITNWLPQL